MTEQAERQGRRSRKAAGWVAEEIRRMILENTLCPGELINECRIGEKLGVSRTPVREAIGQLAQEGLLKRIPGRAHLVADMSLDDIKEINDLRMVLEPLAGREAVGRIPGEKIQSALREWRNFRDLFERGTPILSREISEADSRLHGMIIDYCRNSRLKTFLCILRYQIFRCLVASWEVKDFVADSIDQHIEILDLLEKKDADGLEAALRSHILFNNKVYLQKAL